MPSSEPLARWDIFCRVIDNFGDIGVCWRLARQLAAEYDRHVRLWVDDLPAFAHLCPEINAAQAVQTLAGIEVCLWRADAVFAAPGDVVIEAFACRLPGPFEAAMAMRSPPPVWINLDYLSAEDWVSGCHTLPSPHPKLPLTKYFFFPGFDNTTGGLLREGKLEVRRQAFAGTEAAFWRELGFPEPAADALSVSLFAYENPALPALLNTWVHGGSNVCCAAPLGKTLPVLEAFAGRSLQSGDVVNKGQLELRILPFLPQADYDRLLWACDINFVRGEDSFVRAQWAAKPFLWHIYPQNDDAHRVKLDAFLDRYCAGVDVALAASLRELHHAWNGGAPGGIDWGEAQIALPAWRIHARNWANYLSKQEDLCASLVRFCRSKV